MSNIWDVFGRRIGSITKLPDGKQKVYDKNGQPIGSTSRQGTFRLNGKKITSTPMPGLLFNRGNKQPKK